MIYKVPQLLLGLFLLGSPALPAERSVESARLERTGEICFDLPQGLVDWEALAKKTLGKKLEQPDAEALRRPYLSLDGSHFVDLRYPVPVPPQVSEKTWKLLHEEGELVFRPEVLGIIVRYDLDKNRQVARLRQTYGHACVSMPERKLRPAFVVVGEREEWSTVPVKWSAEKEGRWLLDSSAGRHTITPPEFAAPRIKRVLLFRTNGSLPRALVTWEPDLKCEGLCCEFAFSLHELGPKGKVVDLGETGYQCDI